MNVRVEKLSPEAWKPLSENAHLIAFNEIKKAETDRIDFALLAVKGHADLLGYITCKEHDSETVYWQYGGAFPGTRETSLSYLGYMAFVAYCKERYKSIVTVIENDNFPMLKMAMKVGFKIIGLRYYSGNKSTILLEHILEFA